MNIRNDFPMINNEFIYFDNAATTFKPKIVIDKINDYYTKYTSNAHRGDYSLELKVNKYYEAAREKVKSFINAKSSAEIVFTSGTTEGLNMIVFGYFSNVLKENDEIIISKSEHASNILPWFKLSNQKKLKIKYAELDEDYSITLESIKKVITPNTRVISLAHITNVIGDVRPIKEITKFAHAHNILIIVDAAQSIPHIKTDVQYLDCDFLVFSGHKMMGPTGVGVLYGKYELLDKLEPLFLGGGMNESFDNEKEVILQSLPERLEAGTRNISGILGLAAAVDYLSNIGLDNIHKYELELKEYLVDKLSKLNHINLINSRSSSGIITFNVEGIFSQDVAIYLDKYNICVRSGNHCAKVLKDIIKVSNTVRISLYAYNTKAEIDILVELLKDKNKILREMIL